MRSTTASGHDSGHAWDGPGCELFFADTEDPFLVRQLVFNFEGHLSDSRVRVPADLSLSPNRDDSWNPTWRVVTYSEEGRAVAEVEIPLNEIVGADAGPGRVFRFDAQRRIPGHQELLVEWAPIPLARNFSPAHLGFAVLADASSEWQRYVSKDPASLDLLVIEALAPDQQSVGSTFQVSIQRPLAQLRGAASATIRTVLRDSSGAVKAQENGTIGAWSIAEASQLQRGHYEMALGPAAHPDTTTTVPMDIVSWVFIPAVDSALCKWTAPAESIMWPPGRVNVRLPVDSTISVKTDASTVYLKLPHQYTLPGPSFGIFQDSTLRFFVDDREVGSTSAWLTPREFLIASNLPPGRHTVTVRVENSPAIIEGFRLATHPLGALKGWITAESYSELVTNVRADIEDESGNVRTELTRTPHDGGSFYINGLAPGRYRVRFTAYGWLPFETNVVVRHEGDVVDMGLAVLRMDVRARGQAWYGDAGPRFGKTVNVVPGGEFTTLLPTGWKQPPPIRLRSQFKTIPLEVVSYTVLPYGRWNGISRVTLRVPPDTPMDMYDLLFASRWMPSAVCVRPPLPPRFYLAGVSHLYTWGQEEAEYMRRVGEAAQLAGARALIIAVEINPAYIAGALKDIRIPYVVARGNHMMGRWADYFGWGNTAMDDGPMRIATFGGYPYESWVEARELLQERPDATCRVLLCYEGFAPIDLIREAEIDVLFDGHHDDPHPDLDRFPPRTMHLRAQAGPWMRWLPMDHQGLVPSVKQPKDVPHLHMPRKGAVPMRVEFDAPNDGSAAGNTARLINEWPQAFSACQIRLLLQPGRYRITGAKVQQAFDSDDGKTHIIDVTTPVEKGQTVLIQAERVETQ